ncbi:leucine-rich repeat protein [Acetobacterium fimetarium]|nr:leucine-rich repeat protein [Acetobacterium fimetarium]
METKKTISKKRGKKIWSLILTLVMVVQLLPPMAMPVQAEGEVYGVLQSDGTIHETNADNTVPTSTVIADKTTVTHLFAADDVKSIDDWAFCNCEVLTTVTMPKVTAIGAEAFNGCQALTSVEVPAVTLIDEGAFSMDDALVHINMAAVETINTGAFANCEKMETAEMPAATSIGIAAFTNCRVLTTVKMPLITSINDQLFMNDKDLTTVEIPEATSIGAGAFAGCGDLTTVAVPKITAIGMEAFSQCPLLSNLTVGATPPTVGKDAFKACKATTLTIAGGNTLAAVALYEAADTSSQSGYWYGWPLVVQTYALTYNENGGSGTMAEQVFTESTKQALVKNIFERTGYTFAGWNTKQDGTGTAYADGADFTAAATTTLYAQWTEETNSGVTYRTHIQNNGWENTWASDGNRSGTEGQSLRLEAIEINLTGENLPAGAHIEYLTHVQNTGWETDWTRDGQPAGTEGQCLRLEAIQIRLVDMPGYSVQYRTHVQNDGWETKWSADGESAGTEGQSLRLEAIEIRLVRVAPAPGGLTAEAASHGISLT